MAEEFQGGICGGNWWNSSKYLFSSSPCSSVMMNDNIGGNLSPWPSSQDSLDMIKSTRSSNDSAGSISDDNNSAVLQDIPKPTSHDWNQDFINNSGKSDENYSQFLQESVVMNSSMNYCEEFSLENQPLISQGLTTSFPLDSTSYGYTSSLLQTLFGTNSQPVDQLLLDNNQTTNYSSTANCINSSDFSPSMPKASPMIKPSNFQFTNNTPYWNATATDNNISASFLPSSIEKVNFPNFYLKKEIPKKIQHHNQEIGEMASQVVKKASNDQPAFKRQRIETPSPLPTFKVRKEKMGDRVTALQQLVSPFGKTDTASVLHEAIEYIKFLHDQVNVLSTPYLKNGFPPLQHPQANDNNKDQEGLKQDLKSHGLCLVPISSTFPVATEISNDFWTPTFGGSYR